MSKQSYIRGFCKKAAENGLDPMALAQFAVQKVAKDAAPAESGVWSDVWAKVMEAINKAKAKALDVTTEAAKWYGEQRQPMKALIGAGLGSAAGTGLGAALAGKNGLRAGAVLGAVGGGAAAVDWNALAESFKRLQNEDKGGGSVAKTDPAAAAAASNAAKAAVTSSK